MHRRRTIPGIQIFPVPTEWDAGRAASGVQTALTQNPDIKGIYTPAGGVFLSAVHADAQDQGHAAPGR